MNIGTLVRIHYGWNEGLVGIVVKVHKGDGWIGPKAEVNLGCGIRMEPLANLEVL